MVEADARPSKIRRCIGGMHRAKLGTYGDSEKLTCGSG
jgi:hypothetical protein